MPDHVKKCMQDDTKLISDGEHASELQKDLENIMHWTQRWLMKLNIGKCKVMHLGKNNSKRTYTLSIYDNQFSEQTLEVTESERDLGIQLDNKVTFEDQTNIAIGKANSMIGMLKRSFTSRDTKIWNNLYKVYIRSHFVWNPYRQKDIDKLEKIQRRVS
jgi:ribonuclease P/MRP protein subunit RPP40